MEVFVQPGFRDELNGIKIHRLSNILTMANLLHTSFDQLDLWLEAVPGQPNTYLVRAAHDILSRELPISVTFQSQHPDLELPDPRYLEMHAACCRVAHMSGAAGYLDDILDDLDEGKTRVLSEDGSSGKLLDFSLLTSMDCRVAAE